MVYERIMEEVRGRMMEEIVLLETVKAAGKKKQVFRLWNGRKQKNEIHTKTQDFNHNNTYISGYHNNLRSLPVF